MKLQGKCILDCILDKNSLSKMFTSLLFIGCALFVIFRGEKCLQKFLNKPEKTQISYKFNGNMNFPRITICETDEDAYENDILGQCQLNKDDYTKNGPWFGSGNSFCKNPKELYNKMSFKPKDSYIEWIAIETFNKTHEFRSNNITEVLEWEKNVPYGSERRCFSMSVPKKIVTEGIASIEFLSKPFYKLYVHQKGLFRADMAGSSVVVYYDDFSKVIVFHQILELLDYGEDDCIDSRDYEYDMCRQNYIFQVCSQCFDIEMIIFFISFV